MAVEVLAVVVLDMVPTEGKPPREAGQPDDSCLGSNKTRNTVVTLTNMMIRKAWKIGVTMS